MYVRIYVFMFKLTKTYGFFANLGELGLKIAKFCVPKNGSV